MTPREINSGKQTFIEETRRKQIIDAALQTIAVQGYSQTTFAKIAEQLGITKGLITYHFNGKQDLIGSVIYTIINNQAAYIKTCVNQRETATDKLRTYIEASLEYIERNRPHFVALVDLWGSFTSADQKHAFSQTFYGPCISQLQAIIQTGQENGEFSQFDAKTMTHVLQGAIDGVMLQWVFDPNVFALADCTHAIVEIFVQRASKKS